MTIRITIDDNKSDSNSYKNNYKSKYKRGKYKKKKKITKAFGFDKMMNQMVPR